MTEQIDDDDLERFLGPQVAEWNQLKPVEVRGLRAAPLAADASVAVTYVSERSTPFGYEYVEFEFRNADVFTLKLLDRPGALPTSWSISSPNVRSLAMRDNEGVSPQSIWRSAPTPHLLASS